MVCLSYLPKFIAEKYEKQNAQNVICISKLSTSCYDSKAELFLQIVTSSTFNS
jgi:hypothetical protein